MKAQLEDNKQTIREVSEETETMKTENNELSQKRKPWKRKSESWNNRDERRKKKNKQKEQHPWRRQHYHQNGRNTTTHRLERTSSDRTHQKQKVSETCNHLQDAGRGQLHRK